MADIQAQLRRMVQVLLSQRVLPAMVLAGSLGVTAVLWQGASADAEQEAQADFDGRVRELVNQLDQRMQTYVQVLYGVQGLFYSSFEVDRDEFRSYLAGQELGRHFPGVQAIGYIRLIDGAQREAHEALVRRTDYRHYHLVPPGVRPWYAPTVYMEPFNESNRSAIGFDSASDPVRRAALEQARDSGQPAMTGRIGLVQDEGKPPHAGFLIMLPLYTPGQPVSSWSERRAAIRGWVFAPFRVGDLMAGLGNARTAALDVEIYDGDRVTPEARMYDSAPAASATLRESVQQISIAGHRWTLRIAPLPGAPARADRALMIAGFGVPLSALAAWVAWMLTRARVRAHRALARSRILAGELKDGQAALMVLADSAQSSQAMLRSILDSTIDGILVDNLKGSVLNSNRRFRELWNVPECLDWQSDGAVLMRHMCEQLYHPDSGLRLDDAQQMLLPGVQRGMPVEAQHELLRLKDGRVIEQHTRGLRLGSEPARIWSFRDITERTHTERREQTRRHVLELLATGAPLHTILESVVQGVETDNEDLMCCVMLLDEPGEHLLVTAAPSLPAFFIAAVHGMPVHARHSACGEAVRTRARVIVEDIRNAPAWMEHRDLAVQARLGSCWSDPIFGAGGNVLGTFAVFHAEARLPSIANIALIEQAARLAGIAVEQAQAAEAVRAGEARFRSLYDHAPVALWEQDWSAVRAALSELAQSGVDDMERYLGANPSQVRRLASLVRILDVNASALRQIGVEPRHKDMSAITLAQNFDADAMPGFARAVTALVRGERFFSCEGSFERLDGVTRLNELTLLVMPGHTDTLDFVIVSTLDTTEKRRMHDELRVLATTDFLTGLPNRREFMNRLAEEQERLQRDIGACTAVLLLDLDHFKRINDEYGHAAGDAVLRQLSELMRQDQRKIDMRGRIGGEEFAILLPGATLGKAAVFADRLRQRIADTPMVLDDGSRLTVTVSIGIAVMGGKQPGGDAALVRADQALYTAKRGGRNRVVLIDVEADRPGVQVPAASG
ncbi:CHASE domain-containing protein [Oxalobacteraceae bacterium OTU3CINTB1]|nr:CHASE domain-containing protein [Oxalobacteraceae bacterium OTU3CINTB1]